jgi:hypothetical protein
MPKVILLIHVIRENPSPNAPLQQHRAKPALLYHAAAAAAMPSPRWQRRCAYIAWRSAKAAASPRMQRKYAATAQSAQHIFILVEIEKSKQQ